MSKEIVFSGRKGISVYNAILMASTLYDSFEEASQRTEEKYNDLYESLDESTKKDLVIKGFVATSVVAQILNELRAIGIDMYSHSYECITDFDKIGEVKFIIN